MNEVREIIREIIEEAITLKDGKLNIEYAGKEKGKTKKDVTNLGKGKLKPYKKTIKDIDLTVHSVYSNVEGKALKALKKNDPTVVDPQQYNHFIKRTGAYISFLIKKEGVDTIVAPKSSSRLVTDILEDLKNRNPHITIMPDTFKKADVSKVEIDYDSLKRDIPDEDKYEKALDSLEKAMKTIKRRGEFTMKDTLGGKGGRLKKYIINFFEQLDDTVARHITDKHVLLIDDVVTSGSSFSEMLRRLNQYNPEKISAIGIFKTK